MANKKTSLIGLEQLDPDQGEKLIRQMVAEYAQLHPDRCQVMQFATSNHWKWGARFATTPEKGENANGNTV